ncbi:acetamidase/formamidase family protein [Streptomyces beijiangensis]|uniref:Acetamidase/formamidase family protein n=1 Tax=Streptomyces beijiangensis TaxID=163361 RepID=A0A939JID6_9ACTN|nr:acetamidase/formamidase family protein [Streptomyces beijiangensis]MBO0513587.1 acetamidase/formamidase family protein [Streptomyces beijiangensis]
MTSFSIHSGQVHHTWDRAIAPVATLAPGDEVTLQLVDAGGGQLTAESTAADLGKLDFGRLNPVTGPLYVEGAEPGDALVVDILDVEVGEWGWTACIPGFGLLADEFPDPHLRISRITGGYADLLPGLRVPVVPMIGTIGVAPPEPGPHSVIPPRRWGGNMDIRHIGPGARLILPVGVGGALLSAGDTHAAMGDGEVCGTGVETSATVRLRVDVTKGAAPRTPVIETHPVSARTGAALATTGIGPDLMEASRDAVRALIEEITARTGLAPEDAYLLASVAADLKISEVVDAPNWVVSAHLEREVLGAG